VAIVQVLVGKVRCGEWVGRHSKRRYEYTPATFFLY
jgi:hypothetical protein